MEITGKVHCLFEQSGTFKNEFIKLGIPAEDSMIHPDSFDDNRWEECGHGIHFFINKQDAINY